MQRIPLASASGARASASKWNQTFVLPRCACEQINRDGWFGRGTGGRRNVMSDFCVLNWTELRIELSDSGSGEFSLVGHRVEELWRKNFTTSRLPIAFNCSHTHTHKRLQMPINTDRCWPCWLCVHMVPHTEHMFENQHKRARMRNNITLADCAERRQR